MFEKEFVIAELMATRLKQRLSSSEESLFQDWLQADPANQLLFDQLSLEKNIRSKMQSFILPERSVIWNKLTRELRAANGGDHAKLTKLRLWPRIAAAVAIVLTVGVGLLLFNPNRNLKTSQTINVSPGSFGATLTLGNGKKVKLTSAVNGEIARQTGIVITKTRDGELIYQLKEISGGPYEINKLSTSRGECYSLILPDKSKVWLNAASTLTYSSTLHDHGKRKVKLEGEAYFEVFRDPQHPFVVQTDRQMIEVIGTHFNVNSYSDESTNNTTLIQGSVRINNSIMLKPMHQATIYKSGNIRVSKADFSAIAWKDGKFRFDNANLEDVLRQLTRWYNVDFEFQGEISDRKFSGGINRDVNISEVLEILKYTGVHFKINGRKIIVSE